MNEIDPADRFLVDDLPGARVPATRLRNVLDSLQQGRPLSALALNYLQQQGLATLERFARGQITYEAFSKIATAERATRAHAAETERIAKEATRLVEEAKQRAREAAWAAEHERSAQQAEAVRRALETDPKYIAKREGPRLRARFGLDHFIEQPLLARVMVILRRLDDGNRLDDDDVLWLKTEGKVCYSEPIRSAFHEREAEFFSAEYVRTRDPWNAVNASSHYRKCGQPGKARGLLILLPPDAHASPKLKSAIQTTHGGAMRDLGRLDEAMELGEQAHALTPRDFRPCTLLGAVHIESGDLEVGWEWYRKAAERGASDGSIDHDLRRIFVRADNARRDEIRKFLLRADPTRYKWVHDFDIRNRRTNGA